MSEAVYVVFDNETGGLTKDCSLLTSHFFICDKDLEIIDELGLAIKPNDHQPYRVQATALAVNKIDLIEHDKIAITQSEAAQKLFLFLKKHSDSGKIKLIPVGHNVSFDIESVNEHLISKPNWDQFVSYRKLDTGTIMQYLKLKGTVPNDKSSSLGSSAEYFGVTFEGEAHTARADALMCIKLLKKMKAV